LYGVVIAFKDFDIFLSDNPILSMLKSNWVGLQHFRTLFAMKDFYKVFSNTLVISVLKIIFLFPLPILLAILINEVKNGTVASIILTSQNVSEITGKMSELKGAFQMRNLPSFDIGGNRAASLGGKALVIFKSTKYDKIINDFVKYIVSDKDLALNNLKSNNILPSFTTVYRDSYFEVKSDFFNDEKILKLYSSIDSDAYNIGFTYDFKNLNKNIVDAQKKVLKGSDVNFVMQELASKSSTD
jgi:hypothetical protein